MVMRKIKLNRGKLANLPQLEIGEPAVATDDGSLHIGTEQGNVKLAKDADVQAVSQQLADKVSNAEFTDLSDEVFNRIHGGTTIPTFIGSYDEFFALESEEPGTAYFLEKTKGKAVRQFLARDTPSLYSYDGAIQPKEGEPVKSGLKVWVDAKYKDNSYTTKTSVENFVADGPAGELQGFDYTGTSGWVNDDLVFDGTNDKVRFPLAVSGSGMTAEVVYFHPETAFPNYTRAANSNSDLLSLYSFGHAWTLKFTDKARPTATIAKRGDYVHLAAVINGETGKVELYVDGELSASTDNTPFTITGINSVFWGSWDTLGLFPMKQSLFRVYNRALTAEEIEHNFKLTKAYTPPEPEKPVEPEPTPEPVSIYSKSLHQPLLMPKKMRLAGHRGLSGVEPENTVPAFDACGENGMFGVETDIRITKDGHFVCIHDATVDRTTNGTGNVIDMTLSEIRALTIDGGANIANHTDLKVPTLDEFLQSCAKYGTAPMLDLYIDNSYLPQLVTQINNAGFEKSVIYLSRSPAGMKTINQMSDSMVMILNGATADLSKVAENTWGLDNYGWNVDWSAYANFPNAINEGHAAGLAMMAWVINDVETVREAFRQGIDVVSTDFVTEV